MAPERCFTNYASCFTLQIGDEFDQSRMMLLYEVLGLGGNIGQLSAKFKVCQTDC